jgi:hypothetical protein
MAVGAALVLYACIVWIFDRQALLRAMSIVPYEPVAVADAPAELARAVS